MIKQFSLLAAALTIGIGTASAQTITGDTLTLQNAVALAMKASPTILEGQAAIDAANARVGEVAAAKKLQLEGNASYTRIDPVSSIDFPASGGKTQTFNVAPNDNYNAGLTLEQNILDFGRTSSQVNVAESGVETAKDNLGASRDQTVYQTVAAYYGVLATDESIRIEQDQLHVLRENLGIAETREKAGTATSLDPLNIRVRVSAVESQIADLQSSRTRQAAALRRLLGLPSSAPILVTNPPIRQGLPRVLDSLQSLAELQRSEIRVAKDAEETAKLQIEAARTTDNPSLAANITGGVKDGYLPSLTQPKLNWAGTVALRVPILDGGREASAVQEAEANYRAAQARTLDIERGVATDVETALADLQAAEQRLGLTRVQIQEAQQALDVAEVRLKNGAATSLDVLTAQSALEQAALTRAQLNYNSILSEYALERAVGVTIF